MPSYGPPPNIVQSKREEGRPMTMTLTHTGPVLPAQYTPERTRPAPMDDAVYEALKVAVLQAYPRQGRRNLLILQSLRVSGLRISELLRVRRMELQQDGPHWFFWVTRSKKKGALPERVWLSPLLGLELTAYSREVGGPLEGPLFQGDKVGVALTRRMVGYVFMRASMSLRIQVWPHRMRRGYYSWLRDHGVPARAAAAMIGDTEAVAERHYLEDVPDAVKQAAAERMIV